MKIKIENLWQMDRYFQMLIILAVLLAILFGFKSLNLNGRNPFATSLGAVKKINESFQLISRETDENGLGDMQHQIFEFKSDNILYDDFYASIYDKLVFSDIKNEYEIGQIVNQTNATSESIVLDIGAGTGHHVALLNEKGIPKSVGVDQSKAMIEKAQKAYPNYKFELGDILNLSTFPFGPNTFTHILCMYFTYYYIRNQEKFFENCFSLLRPGGHLIVHLVDRNKFDPILPAGNPFLFISPQSYAKERITKTKVNFFGYDYTSAFHLDKIHDQGIFDEKIKDTKSGKIRNNQHKLYMQTIAENLRKAQNAGFIVQGKIDLLRVGYAYQFLYIFYKPS